VLLLHTLRTQLEYFLPLIEAIGPGFDLLAPDLPGHGRSSAPAVEYTATHFTDAVEQFLDEADLDEATVVGESIGASIALALAAREPGRFRHVVALNPYDYGWGGGIRRSSKLANLLVTSLLLPGIGSLVFAVRTKGMIHHVLRGGFHDPIHLSSQLVDELWACGEQPGHPSAFLSLLRQWRTWSEARVMYSAITTPATLVYS
jgi:pimeloyl-ACP methyl ester carboxylesterase